MKKKLTSMLLALSMVLAVSQTLFLTAPIAHAAGNIEGSGTEADPYIINEVEDFTTLYSRRGDYSAAGMYNDKYIRLDADLDLTGKTPPGSSGWLWTNVVGFAGYFDGDGHTIKGLTVPFIRIFELRTLDVAYDVKVENNYGHAYNFRSKDSPYNSLKHCWIKNLNIKGDVTSDTCGGFIGTLDTANGFLTTGLTFDMENCTFEGSVTGTQDVGGLIGKVHNCAADCYLNISDCYVNASISNTSSKSNNYRWTAGGIVGSLGMGLNIERSYFSGDVNSNDFSAGLFNRLVSSGQSPTIVDNTSSTPYAENPWTIKDCYSSGTIAGRSATGALITFICGTGTSATATSRTDAINGTSISESYGYDENYNDVIGSDYSVSTDSICTNVYNLKPTSISEANGVTGLTSDEFKTAANFTGFDFADTWLMSSSLGRPILRSVSEGPGYPVPDVPENIDIEAEHGEGTELDLSNYILSTSGEDLSDNFTYTIDDEDNEAFTGTVHNWVTDEDEEGITGYLATVNDKIVSFSGQAGIGTHTVTVKGTYIGEEAGGTLGETADDIEFTITETVTKTVPAPESSTYTFPYSAAMRLKYISLNDLWQWEKPETLPRANAYYNVVYPVEEGKEAYYKYSDIEDAVYDADKDGIVSSIQLFVTDSEESPWSIAVTVLNADNNEPIEGAVVSSTFDYEFPEETRTTNSSGVASGEMTAGSHIIYANAENFTENSATKVVDATNGNTLTIKLTPTRVDAVLPTLYNDSGKAVPCSATLTKLDADTNPAEQWNGGSASATYKGGSTQQLPTGTYLVRLSAYGYTDQTVYMKVAYPDTVTYYSDDSFDDTKKIEPEDLAETTKSEKIGDAVYTYDFTKNVADNTVTATVKLKNTVASMGTLGISYDPELFTLNPATGVVLNSSLNLTATTPYEEYAANIGATGIPAWTSDRGYYVFRWVVGDNTSLDGMSQSLDTINNETLIATFTFSLNTDDGYDWDYVTSDSFNIMPWTDTEEAQAYKTWYDAKYAANPEAAGDYEFEEYWRECDNENSPFSLGVGRIEKLKATVNGEDMGGFYQVAVNEQLGSENLVSFYDVLSVVNMFDTTNTSLRFTVTDQETGAAIEGATVVLYPTDAMLPQTRYTNAKGIAKFMVDASAEEDVDYNYTVTINGYWPVEATPVTVQPKVAKNIEVELEKKIYHVPEVKGVGGGESPLELVTNMDLGGERYGYNGRDFHFRAKAAPGYTIDTYPTQATVVIGIENEDGYETTTIILTEGDNHMFTLDKSFLHQAELEKSKLATLYGGSEDDYTQPNENGYRSYNIEITFDKYRADEKALEVRGIAGEHGTVAYDNGNPADSMAATEVTADHEYVVSGIVPGKTGYEQTGTFTFAADTANGYKVEKVFINGIQTHKYDNKDNFTYSFDKPETDCSIIVSFWDGIHPSGDSIITLIVGDYGAVNVTEPEEKAETGVRETTRTYLNPGKVKFTTVPDTGYQLYAIKTQIDDGAIVSEDLSDIADLSSKTDNSFEFLPENGKTKKIYVTFKNPNAPKTPTIFVKSYVERGEGTIDPFGLLVYNIYDTVEFDLTSDIGYDVWGVKVSPLGKTAEGTEHQYPALKTANTYTIDSIEEDTEVGAIFEEHRYVIKGTVDLSQNSDLVNGPWAVSSTPNILTGALVTFVRVGDINGDELDKTMTLKTVTAAKRKDASFSIEIPVGTWNIYVTKQGYVNYVITDYLFKADGEQTDGAFTFSSNTIVPIIGSTTDGKSVSVKDIAGVRSGLRENLNDTAKAKADVDNNGVVDVTDMTFILNNFGERTTYELFSTFDN